MVVTGGTGSLGKALVRRLLGGELGQPRCVAVFSRDEAKQHELRLQYENRRFPPDDVVSRNSRQVPEFIIGDVRDYHAVACAIRNAEVIFNAAALKQVPNCEYFPLEAVQTNVCGAENIIRAIRENHLPAEAAVVISTDKAVKPVSVMGMTKAIQERLWIAANLTCPKTRFICVRYGNVLASRGSVIPLFHEQIRGGGPVTVTAREMTRFLLSMEEAVDTIFAALGEARPGETYVPRPRSARMIDLARALIGDREIRIEISGVRPGEKVHEIMISEEERCRTVARGKYFAIQPILPELRGAAECPANLPGEYSSAAELMDYDDLCALLEAKRLRVEDAATGEV